MTILRFLDIPIWRTFYLMLTTDSEINVHTIEKVAMFKAVYSVSVT